MIRVLSGALVIAGGLMVCHGADTAPQIALIAGPFGVVFCLVGGWIVGWIVGGLLMDLLHGDS